MFSINLVLIVVHGIHQVTSIFEMSTTAIEALSTVTCLVAIVSLFFVTGCEVLAAYNAIVLTLVIVITVGHLPLLLLRWMKHYGFLLSFLGILNLNLLLFTAYSAYPTSC